ncbi:UDP-N-acetylmuramoyl-L-alanine--D-glutamate ligase [Alkalimarinus alittae]|uniref:UDP-N-acetylmuramoylalanine--D-glutamate ligase n=1 Tax=Alkalimarinus alittae TaxID=2961619 RepID=A0ABY6N0D7_9ALTE|nr:UDP-N-acetylmuramoyl-L-alanine--D-glutamate ligase [Alkalimarinus alittae]UZE95561.1 UDP-N-acetylmuramoyl-L-alanine--D-glutamate ligase [Alkalimarinus alittae]
MSLIATDNRSIVVGLGITGLSCVRYLKSKGHQVVVVDSRENPPGIDACRYEFPDVHIECGAFNVELLASATQLIVSPGVSIAEPSIQEAKCRGVDVRGDVDIFRELVKAPIVAITGSNGKSTVTTLLAEMAKQAGINVAVGGNLGIPVLDLLDDSVELYVVELSSFQLETTQQLNALAATILNISEDHMDRYPNKLAYLQAKQKVFQGCRYVIVNEDDVLSEPLLAQGMEPVRFGVGKPDIRKFSTISEGDDCFICYGFESLINVNDVAIKGTHNISNALAALSLGHAAGIGMDAMLETLRHYTGLAHRCQWVRRIDGVDYINDSKGTNVGATVTAVESFGQTSAGKVVLIAGGEGKGADFSPLREVISAYGRVVILFGRDADKIKSDLADAAQVIRVNSLAEAVKEAQKIAQTGDTVLMSPACASFDMFRNFEARGDVFVNVVEQL